MALTSLNDIKNWFKTNLIPTQQQFYDMFDSFRHKSDKVAASDIDGLTNLLAAKASEEGFNTHTTAENAHAGLFGALRNWVENQIVGVGVSSTNLGALTPLTVIPATINVYGFAVEAGTYANCDGLVVPINSLAFLSRVGGVWGISKTGFDISSKVNVSDIADNLTTDSAVKVASSRQVKVLNEKFNGYSVPTSFADNLVLDPYFIDSTVGSTSAPVGYSVAILNSVESLVVKSDSDFKGNALQLTINSTTDDYDLEVNLPVSSGYVTFGFLTKQNIAKRLITDVYFYQFNSAGAQIGSTGYFSPVFTTLNTWTFLSIGKVTLEPLCASVRFGFRFGGKHLTAGDSALITISGITASQSESVLYAPKRNIQREILKEKALLSAQTASDIALINAKLDLAVESTVTNDWYDPYFTKPYSGKYFASPWCHFNWYNGGGQQGTQTITPYEDVTKTYPSCAKVILTGSFEEIGLSFSKEYLNQLNYVNGETFKCGLYVKFLSASPSTIRNVYVYKIGGSTPQTIAINNSNWNWVSLNDSVTVNDNALQGYNFNFQSGISGEIVLMTGLTLVNTTKNVWPNKFLASKVFNQRKTTVKNQYIFEEFIDVNTPLYASSYEQNSKVFTKEIVDLRTDNSSPIKSDAVKFTSSVGNNFTLNTSMTSLSYNSNRADGELFPLNRDTKIKMGCWVKCEGNGSEVFSAAFYDNSVIATHQNHRYTNLEMNKWIWVESLAVTKLQAEFKGFNNSFQMQLQHSPTTTCSFYVAGITYGYVDDNSLNFGYARYYDLDNIGKWYRRKFTSYGDSITAANQFQKNIMSKLSMQHYERGIGGASVIHQAGSVAWVDVNGKLLGQSPSAPPAGTNGVDYFTIERSMCRQQRVDTIPLDSEFILIMAGTNDGGNVIGNVTDAPSDISGASFYAAYKSMLDKVIMRVPKATIVLLDITYVKNESTTTFGGIWKNEYRVAVKALADLYGLPFIKLVDLGVNDKNWSSYSADIVHPNAKFNKLIGDRIVKGLIEKTASLDENKL